MLTKQRVTAVGSMAAVLLLAGCRQDMHNQPKFIPQRGTTFFADGRSVRPQVLETVARGQLDTSSYFFTGMNGNAEGNSFPLPVNAALLHRGQEQYNLFCTPCHSRVGNGQGMIVERGYRPAGNFHTDRLRNAPLGHFFSVITNGYGAMPEYASQMPPEDRWAVVAYIRALQLSQDAGAANVGPNGHVEPITEVEKEQGFAPGFVYDWPIPATENVYGTPNGDDNGIPGYNGASPNAKAGIAQQSTGGTPHQDRAPAIPSRAGVPDSSRSK